MSRKIILFITFLSFIIATIGIWQTDKKTFNTFLSFFISIYSLLLLLLFISKWFWQPSGNNSKRVIFKSNLIQGFDRAISQGHSAQLGWLALVFIALYIVMAGWMGTFNSFNLLPENVGGLNPFSLTFMLFTDSGTLGDALKAESQISGCSSLRRLTLFILLCILLLSRLITLRFHCATL